MESWEVLHQAVETVGVKVIAGRLRVSSALVYKWCQEPPVTDPPGSGARNPLDRLKILYETTRDAGPVNWLCNAAGGFFVLNPHVEPGERAEQLLGTTQQVVEDFGQLLSEVSRSIENDGVISSDESERIRQSWERLKSHAEAFVVACEQGTYSQPMR